MSRPVFVPARRQWLATAGGAALVTGLAPAFVRHARAAEVPRFELGIASGFPRPDRLVLWTRLTGAALPAQAEVQWELASDEAFRDIVARGSETALAAEAHSVHAEPADLAPGRWYWYRFRALGQQSAVGRTRTAPASDAATTLRFVTTSCQRWDHGHFAAWRDVAEQPPDLVLFLGDYIYESARLPLRTAGFTRQHDGLECRTLDDYRARYAQYKRDPALQAAHAAAPWLFVWDDHEVDNDYAGLTPGGAPDAAFAQRRAAAYQAYWEHQPLPRAMKPAGPDARIYGAYDWGQLARILCVDDRQYRDPQACPRPGRGGSNSVLRKGCAELADPRRSLLGATQERWLADQWSTHQPWNLLAQQTLMTPFEWRSPQAPDDTLVWTDGWDGYAPARARLLGTVAERRLSGCVVLGGDVHASYVADLHAEGSDPARGRPIVATEFCGTSISSLGMAQERIDAALPHNPQLHYGRSAERGYLRFTLDARSLQAEVRAVDQPLDPASAVRTAARFVVEAGRPGAQRA
ncbi:MAG: alkaline phosphatase D family protein [Burkholderiales bacterium]